MVVVVACAAVFFVAHALPSDRPSGLLVRGPAASKPVLAFRWTRDSGDLLRVDAKTLRPLRGRSLRIADHSLGWSFSPNRRLLALGDSGGRGEVWLVDSSRIKVVRSLDSGTFGSVVHTAWIRDRLVAVLDQCCYGGPLGQLAVVSIDLGSGDVRATRNLRGQLLETTTLRDGVALLLAPPSGLGDARLLLVDSDGEMRETTLPGIRAGHDFRDGEPLAQQARPGLAVDRVANRAFVVAAGAPVAQVDLTTMQVSHHELSAPVSLRTRLSNWLVPSADAKTSPVGPERRARWLANGYIAVWGTEGEPFTDKDGYPSARQRGSGVQLINIRSWTVRTLDRRASMLTLANGALLVYGTPWQADSGIGLRGYGPDGSLRFHGYGSKPLTAVRALGSRVFVEDASDSYAVLDARTGRTLRRVAGSLPEPLVR